MADHQRFDGQLVVLWRCARLQRAAISLAAAAALLASVLIIVLFVSALLSLQSVFPIVALFIGCLVAIIASLVCFLCDINLALHALALSSILRSRGIESDADGRSLRTKSPFSISESNRLLVVEP